MRVLRLKLSRDRARQVIATLPAVLAGKAADPAGLSRALSLRLGLTALAFVKQAFVAKAAGNADEAGQKWAPHAPSTARRRGPGAQIGRDTGVLLNSLGPGAVIARAGEVSIATNVPYAAYFHEQRPLWPEPADWPDRWWASLNKQLLDGTQAVLEALLRGAQ